eukprot:2495111-Alexandrium_andersonii.AAC.1
MHTSTDAHTHVRTYARICMLHAQCARPGRLLRLLQTPSARCNDTCQRCRCSELPQQKSRGCRRST